MARRPVPARWTMINPACSYVDRYNIPLRVGQHVRIQHCVGPYRLTKTIEGELREIDKCHGITLHLPAPINEFYVPSIFRYSEGVMLGYRQYEDIEHAHEAWIEVVA